MSQLLHAIEQDVERGLYDGAVVNRRHRRQDRPQ